MKLTPIDVTGLDAFGSPCDLRRDLHIFVRCIQEREVKRSHRGNNLSKSDSLRLAKMMSDPEAVDEVKEHGSSGWVDYIDGLALKLGFVSYDTQGTYVGYTSSEPSFPDNYIQFNAPKYRQFLESPLARQERLLLDTLLEGREGCDSEFYRTSVLGRLSGFSSWGCATGVVPTLNFSQVRRFLLDLLQTCQVGVWYSTSSLVQYLKTAHPFFLIPQNPDYKDRWGREKGRYGNFHESKDQWGYEVDISEHDPDAFERVEGRYLERFLGYVDVAYSSQPYKGLYPPIHTLKAFRVNNRLWRVMKGDIPPPKVTVQPNFEIYVESEFYPANVLAQLVPLADVVSEDILTILRLQKERVAAQLAQDEELNVVALLTQLAGRELPPNVARELDEWAEHSEKFTLYEGFALLEGDEDLPAADPFTVERISPTIRIVHSPDALFARLEKAELVPLRVEHPASALRLLPPKARTVFAQKTRAAKPKPKTKEPVTLMRHTTITLHFPTGRLLEKFRQALLDIRCPVEADKDNLTITFSRRYEPQVDQVVKALEKEYLIRIEDIE
jgi:hypothetical protein